jgi:hypothetical protein
MFQISDEDSPVFVQISANGLVRNLALPPNEERALVVGSTAGAAFHLTGDGIAPVQFHLERDEEAVWLIPAYRVEDLRLNSAPVVGPAALEQHNVIEFADVRLQVLCRDAETFTASGDLVSNEQSKHEFGPSYSANLPGEADATQLAMPPLKASTTAHHESSAHEGQQDGGRHVDERLSVNDAGANSRATLVGQRIVPIHAAVNEAGGEAEFTRSGTQIIRAYRPPVAGATALSAEANQWTSGETVAAVSQHSEDRCTVDTVRLVPLRHAPRPQHVAPRPKPPKPAKRRTAAVAHADARSVVPPPLGRHPLSFATASDAPPLRDTDAEKSAVEAKPSFLGRIGLLTQARLLLVGGIAGFGAVLIVVLLRGVTRLVAPHDTQHRTASAQVVAELSPLRPATLEPDPAVTPVRVPTASSPNEVLKPYRSVRANARPRAAEATGEQTPSVEQTRARALY